MPLIDKPAPKVKQRERKSQILALRAAGLTQTEIAKQFGVSRASIVRDFADLKPAADELDSRLNKLNSEISRVITVEARAKKYAKLATSAKNEAVSLGALQRIDDLDGIVTDKERLRAKQSEQPNRPMFVFNGGLSIDFGGGTPQHIDKDANNERHNSTNAPIVDVTPIKSSE